MKAFVTLLKNELKLNIRNMNTLFDISVDEFFYPDKLGGESERRKRIDRMLNDMDEKELIIIEGGAESKKFSRLFGTWKIFAALDSQLLLCDRPGPWPGLLILSSSPRGL